MYASMEKWTVNNPTLCGGTSHAPREGRGGVCRLEKSYIVMMSYTGSGRVSSARHVMVDGRTPSMLIFSP